MAAAVPTTSMRITARDGVQERNHDEAARSGVEAHAPGSVQVAE